jgi:anaerobic selenocysteine-containing dehydrogenase
VSEDRELSRRNFLRGAAAAAVALPAAGCQDGDPYALEKPPVPGEERWRRHQEKSVATACGQCPAGCGLNVRVVEGRAVKIEGDPDNPINEGGIGPRGLAGLQALYDPDRIRQPLRRKGPRGSGQWEPISWDSALDELTTRLRELRTRSEAQRVGILCGRERGIMRDLWGRFATSYGTPNFYDTAPEAGGAISQASALMQGVRETPSYDWDSVRYVLSVGAGVLDASCQSISFARTSARLKRGRTVDRGKIVDIEASYSRTAASADEWIAVAPGSYAAFTLGICHILVEENAYDRRFVEDRCFGFDDWTDENGVAHRGFRSVLASDYTPEQVARICEIDPGTLDRIARELADQRPAFAITHPRATQATNGLHTAMAVHALNALLGAIDRPGGVLTQRAAPLAPWPPVEMDDAARAGLAAPRVDGTGRGRNPLTSAAGGDLASALLEKSPYGLDTLLLYYANPCYAWMNPERWRRALSEVPFIATFTPFMDETATEVADLILPDHTYLERWEDAAPAPGVSYPIFGVRQPVVEPLYDTRATGDVVIEVAKGLGGSTDDAFPWKSFRSALLKRASGIHAARRGSIVESSSKKFFRKLFREGFWADPPYPFEAGSDAFDTPSGKFEFFSLQMWHAYRTLAESSGEELPELLSKLSSEKAGVAEPDLVCMPRHQKMRCVGDAEEYPLMLEPFKSGTYAEGSGANLPLLQALVTEPGASPWTTTAQIHPGTAEPLGIREGDRIAVESPAGRIELPVHLQGGVWPGVVRIPQGGGHTAFGRFAKGLGANVMELLAPSFDPYGGFEAIGETRVRVKRIES